MAKYEDLLFFDVIEPILGLFNQRLCWINKDGLIDSKIVTDHNAPWLFGKLPPDRDCDFLARVLFKHYRILPRTCLNCWKVVTHPRNLEEAYKMLELQKEMGIPSKTGMEQREYSGHRGGWSSFWYCPIGGGLEGARETFAKVEEAVANKFGVEAPDVNIKRACTEMEKAAGPSDKWQYPVEAELKENMVRSVFVPYASCPQPRFLEVHIERQWIEWAAAHGDLTYLKHCEGPIISPQVLYNGSIHSDRDFEPIEEGENDRDKRLNDRGSSEGCSCESKDCSCSRGNKGGSTDKPAQGIVLV